MTSSYSTDLKIELMVTGENAGTWGTITNTNLVLLQQAIAGYEGISIAGGAQTTALTMANGALSNARNAVIRLTGSITGNQIVTIPAGIEKTYIVSNGTTGGYTVEFKPVGGTGATWTASDKGIKILYSDGTNISTVDLSTISGQIATASIAPFAVQTATLDTYAVTGIKITNSTITQAKLAANSVGANQIIQSTITQSKLAVNSVGANQLIATGVTAASYTNASITVDADGRITSASSGGAAAGAYRMTLFKRGGTSGTYTAQPTASRLQVYAVGGGGGGGPFNSPSTGGAGGFGLFFAPISQPFSTPYSVGSAGSSSAGGDTLLGPAGSYIDCEGGPRNLGDPERGAPVSGSFTAFIGSTGPAITNKVTYLYNMYGIPYLGTYTQTYAAPTVSYQTGYIGKGGSTGPNYMEGATYGYYPTAGALIILENIDS